MSAGSIGSHSSSSRQCVRLRCLRKSIWWALDDWLHLSVAGLHLMIRIPSVDIKYAHHNYTKCLILYHIGGYLGGRGGGQEGGCVTLREIA